MVINLSNEHSIIGNWLAEIRDTEIQKDRQRFRRNLERIGEVAAYEISKGLPFVQTEVQTPAVIQVNPRLFALLRNVLHSPG
jgi:uracil phosphoribosyltransferase